jgi:hypothetical protein
LAAGQHSEAPKPEDPQTQAPGLGALSAQGGTAQALAEAVPPGSSQPVSSPTDRLLREVEMSLQVGIFGRFPFGASAPEVRLEELRAAFREPDGLAEQLVSRTELHAVACVQEAMLLREVWEHVVEPSPLIPIVPRWISAVGDSSAGIPAASRLDQPRALVVEFSVVKGNKGSVIRQRFDLRPAKPVASWPGTLALELPLFAEDALLPTRASKERSSARFAHGSAFWTTFSPKRTRQDWRLRLAHSWDLLRALEGRFPEAPVLSSLERTVIQGAERAWVIRHGERSLGSLELRSVSRGILLDRQAYRSWPCALRVLAKGLRAERRAVDAEANAMRRSSAESVRSSDTKQALR